MKENKKRRAGGAEKILMGALEDLLWLHFPRELREAGGTRLHLTYSKDLFVSAPWEG